MTLVSIPVVDYRSFCFIDVITRLKRIELELNPVHPNDLKEILDVF